MAISSNENEMLQNQLTELISGVQDEGLNFDSCTKDGNKPTVVENVTLAQHLMSCGVTIHTKAIPRLPFPDGDRNILSCPWCRSGEFLHNADGTQMPYCGQCGQAIKWESDTPHS